MAKVLVVEDETPLAETIAFNLREEGYKVCIAADGISALDMLRQEKPDLALLDVMLPGVDGLEVCRLIRKTWDIRLLNDPDRTIEYATSAGRATFFYVRPVQGIEERSP